jgi:hypothetical protein
MKKVVSLLIALSLMIVANLATVSAQGPSGSYVSGVSCVDLSGTGATLVVTVYASADSGGASLGSFNDSIGAGSNVLYFTGTATDKIGSLMSSNSTGSVVVSSDKEIACSLNTQTNSGVRRTGTSNGLAPAATANKLFVPQALRLLDGANNLIFGSYVAIQNAGGTSTTTVTAKFFNASGTEIAAAQQTFDIPPNSSHIFYQDSNTNLGSSFNGSATFESDDGTALAGTAVLFNASTTLLTYDAFAGGSSTVIGPRFVKNLSSSTLMSGLACQNLGGAPTNITATFNILNQDTSAIVNGAVTKSNVGPNQSFLMFAGNFTGDAANAALNAIAKGFGSVTVSSSGADIACTFNENSTTAGSAFNGTGSTYNGVSSTGASNTITFPQIVALGAASFRGGFQYANTTGTAATCSHTYATSTGVLGTLTGKSLAASGSNSVFAETEMAGSGNSAISTKATTFNGSVTVTCDQPIVGIYNLAALTLGGDTFTTNTGVNVGP